MEDRRSLPPHEDELSLALLRSAEHDEPSKAAYSKVATALGVGAVVGLGASLPAPAALASSGLSGAGALRWSSSLLGKAVVGVSGALLVAGSVALLHHRSEAAGVAQGGSPGTHAASGTGVLQPVATFNAPVGGGLAADHALGASPSAASAAAAVSASAPEPAVASAASTGSGLSALAVPVAKNTASQGATGGAGVNSFSASNARAARASSLPEQVSSLDRARVALDSGDSRAALAEIAHYRSTWPKGVFLTEASVLEIEALAKRGETALAAARAQAFVTAHPDSPQASRLRALIPASAR